MAEKAESYSVRRRSAKAPFNTHPAFPGIVVLWFAALLGGGTLTLPVALVERLVALTGLAALIPSAAPPLGETARAAIALAGAVAGALVGWAVARKVAAQEPAPPRIDVDQARPCRPILAHEELGEEGFGSRIDTPVEPPVPQDQPRTDEAVEGDAPLHPVSVEALDEQPAADARRPLAELGLMQLTARLNVALAQRKARPAPRPLAASFEAADAVDAARARALFFDSSARAEPAGAASPRPMKNPLARQQEFVRAGKPANRSDGERNLRAAPVTLHRRGGAA